MNTPTPGVLSNASQLLTALDQCMLKDRIRLRRAIIDADRNGCSLAHPAQQVEASASRVRHRPRRVPQCRLPDELPISQHRDKLIQLITEHQVLVVCGETGSGKSTQLPKICLQAGFGIKGMICQTQPRRIAARSVAVRVAEELGSATGQDVGFRVRFSEQISPEILRTSLHFLSIV